MANPTWITTASKAYNFDDVIKYAHWFAANQWWEAMSSILENSFEKALGSKSQAKKLFLEENGAQWYAGERGRKPVHLSHPCTAVCNCAGSYDAPLGNWWIAMGSLPIIKETLFQNKIEWGLKFPGEWDLNKTIGYYSQWILQNNKEQGLRWGDQISLIMVEQTMSYLQGFAPFYSQSYPSLGLYEWTLLADFSTKLGDAGVGFSLPSALDLDWFGVGDDARIYLDDTAWHLAHPRKTETQGGHVTRIVKLPRYAAAMLTSRRRYKGKSKPLKVSPAQLVNLETPSAGMFTNMMLTNKSTAEDAMLAMRESFVYYDTEGVSQGYVLNMQFFQQNNIYV